MLLYICTPLEKFQRNQVMEIVSLSTTSRTDTGRKGTKAIRKSGGIPAVMYGGGEVKHFSTNIRDVKPLIYTPKFKLAEIDVDGTKHKAILKDIQFHPVSDEVMHIDFQKLVDGVKVKVNIPVKYEGTSPGVKEGGKLITALRTVKVKTTPENLVDELIADISSTNLGEAIRVKDLQIGEGIEVMTDLNIPVASVNVPRVLKATDEELEAEEAAEGEVPGGDAPAGDAPAADAKG